MEKVIILFLLSFFNAANAQEKMITNKGVIHFEASVPSFEEVKAENETVSCILNTKTGEIASLALMKEFSFKIALMGEHFNENYVESDKYPKATFEGIIQGFNINIIGTSPKVFKMNGKLEVHGKSKEINTIVTLRKINDALEISANFDVNTYDFNIEIPQMLANKISKTVNVKTNFLLK